MQFSFDLFGGAFGRRFFEGGGCKVDYERSLNRVMGHFFKFKLMAKINLATDWGSVTDAGVPAWAAPKFLLLILMFTGAYYLYYTG